MDKLIIYQKSLELVKEIYLLVSKNKIILQDYSLSNQLKRAAVSVPTNISEGYVRTKKHFKSYLKIASGSTNELVTLLKIVELVHEIDTEELQIKYQQLGRQIMAFYRKI